MTLSRDSIVAGLVAQGVPRDRAELVAEKEIDREQLSPSRFAREADPRVTVAGAEHWTLGAPIASLEIQAPAIEWPVRLLLPWSLLVSDNERKEPYLVHEGGKPHARMRLTKRYREAKAKIEQLARGKLGVVAAAADVELELTAKVWVPGGSYSRNDVCNFGKGVHDALEGIVYVNDNQLHATHWLRAGVDVDAPRAELTIAPLPISGG